ncbi:UvrD-helicase domain-containing protein [Galbibacter sp. EGI 63066]|uniref:UvrD-helicase domain-containing protein n=1 Tax=Galbibacter sp. EGI 63066 TaxID=2993559 RepID=UPI0022492CEB|nr:UvrD-helicase domain-containing protein [Galbibacter sp. EGI 63066]MCX2678937.1 UvrD-helicase domain-containing protein [Galbibacter sp. EGI 63066]
MLNPAPFQIFNASAGSGKTYTLVKRYLSILLASSHPDTFKQVLAITFTNKAVNEMKERVIGRLNDFSQSQILDQPTQLFSDIAKQLNIPHTELHHRAKKVLARILHNYAFFDIVTIDKFNHRLLRTFAFDLKLPTNFEVSLDEEILIDEAVDNLIYQAGDNKLLTETLINFALEKTDDDKSWDIARDLKEIAKLLSKEDYIEHIKSLSDKKPEDFKALGKSLKKLTSAQEKELVGIATHSLELITENGLDYSDFSRKSLPNFLQKIVSKDFDVKFTYSWQQKIETDPLYNKSTPENVTSVIDKLQPQLASDFLQIKKGVGRRDFLQDFYKNLVPLSLLNSINSELQKIKKERNLLLISEFNRHISSAIANQPAPFIYERIGEKYRHYFIDEFQDTSTMQWENIQPLVSNALETQNQAGKTGSLLIVGDAKQAIYRWRGGKVEQFIGLYNEGNPFQVEKKVTSLPKNFRSFDEIVNFNNRFFNYTSTYLNNTTYRDLFEKNSHQETNDKPGGYIDFTFVDENSKEEADLAYCERTFSIVEEVIQNGFEYQDICVLTRTKNQGSTIADYLSEQGIPIISSESLLLKNDKKVDFIIQLISYFNQPDDLNCQFNMLRFLSERKQIEDQHHYFQTHLQQFSKVFDEEGFDINTFLQLPFYNAVEYAINAFGLAEGPEAYLQFFLDEILNFTQNHDGSLNSFLGYWEQKKEKLSIVAPAMSDAVKIMTIHKSKGLEFPVLIYPYANTDIYREKNFNLWFPVNKEDFGLEYALLSKKSVVENFNETGKALIEEYDQKMELDQFNLLYVALTRAVEQLYLVCKKDINAKGVENTKTFAGFFINYLKAQNLWQDGELHYKIGNPKRQSIQEKENTYTSEDIPFITNTSFGNSFTLITKAGSLWDTKQQKAIEKGNIYHHLLSKIYHKRDLEPTVTEAVENGLISEEEKPEIAEFLLKLINHPDLSDYFTESHTIYNEREIITKEGISLRPDRFMVKNGSAALIDYKTGAFIEKYRMQLDQYAGALHQIGYQVTEKLLVFINDDIEVKKI